MGLVLPHEPSDRFDLDKRLNDSWRMNSWIQSTECDRRATRAYQSARGSSSTSPEGVPIRLSTAIQ